MNEEARALAEARRVLFDFGTHPAFVMAFEQHVRRSARTFSAEDVERVTKAFLLSAFRHSEIRVTPEVLRNVRAALAAIGTVEEAQ